MIVKHVAGRKVAVGLGHLVGRLVGGQRAGRAGLTVGSGRVIATTAVLVKRVKSVAAAVQMRMRCNVVQGVIQSVIKGVV